VEERAVGTGLDIVDDTRLEVNVDRTGHILATAGLGEERRKASVVLGRSGISQTTVGLFS
jgi:hypothetical protein